VPSVKFFIREGQDKNSWKLVVQELNKLGHKVHTKYKPCDTAIVLSGLFTNPSLFKHSYLFFAKSEWKDMWDTMYGPILSKYYTVMFDCSGMNLEGVVGLLQDTYDNEMGLRADEAD